MTDADATSDRLVGTVRTLLEAAGLTLPDDELAEVAAGYPALRRELDGMFDLPVEREENPDLLLRLD